MSLGRVKLGGIVACRGYARLGVRVRYYLRWARGQCLRRMHSQNHVQVAPSFIMCVSIWRARKACTELDGDIAVVRIGGSLSV